LLQAYPHARLEGTNEMERFARIKDAAFSNRLRERIMPDPATLVARLIDIGKDLAESQSQLALYKGIVERLADKLAEPERSGADLHTAFSALGAWMQGELDKGAMHADETHPLVIKDSLLRLMVAQVKLLPSGREFFVEGADTILEAALRAGLAMEYGCSNGNCGQCKARVVSGQISKVRHHDYVLAEGEKAAGYALLCANAAMTDLVIEAHEPGGVNDIPLQHINARVKSIEYPANDVAVLQLQTPRTNRLRFLSGQHVTLALASGRTADFPVASCPCDDRNLQFHVRRDADNPFSQQVFGHIRSSDSVSITGPRGDFVLREDSQRPLVFIACDDGFAPIKSLIEHAMALDVAETIHLYWISSQHDGHYLHNLCRAWADALDNFYYSPLSVAAPATDARSGTDWQMLFAPALAVIAGSYPDIAAFDVYVAGPGHFTATVADFLARQGLPASRLLLDSGASTLPL
jgi:CDP-4-dehydro-6-deoxyglucose reductase